MLTIASYVTLLRIVLTPIIIVSMMHGLWLTSIIVFVIALLTDVLDGFIARRFNQQSSVGQVLDPIADKILFGSVMITFLFMTTMPWWIARLLWFLIIKEMILLGGGGVLWFGFKKFIQPSVLSRMVSFCEVIFLSALLMLHISGVVIPIFLMMLIVVTNISLSCWLLIRYGYKIVQLMNSSN